MALVYKDRVKETTSTTGTGVLTLLGAATDYQSFAAIGNANTTYYCIEDGTSFEVGLGTYTSSGTTLSRDTVLASSTGSAISFGAGTKNVFTVSPAKYFTDNTIASQTGNSGKYLSTDGTNTSWNTVSGGVTSVALALPSIFSVSGSPITTSGTLTGTLATQVMNTGLMGPTSGANAAPTFRTLVAADVPNLAWSKITSGTPTTIAGYGITDAVTLPITESNVTGLVSDLASKAPLASPTFTGIPAAPTASAGTNTTQVATTAYVDAYNVPGTTTYSSTPTVNWAGKNVMRLTMTGNPTISMTGAVDGQKLLLELIQDGTGSRIPLFTSEVRFGTDITSITCSTTASKIDRLGLIYNSAAAKYDVIAFVKGF